MIVKQPNITFLSETSNRDLFDKITALDETGVVSVWDRETRTCCIVLEEVFPDGKRRMDAWRLVGPVTKDDAMIMEEEFRTAFNQGKSEGFLIN